MAHLERECFDAGLARVLEVGGALGVGGGERCAGSGKRRGIGACPRERAL